MRLDPARDIFFHGMFCAPISGMASLEGNDSLKKSGLEPEASKPEPVFKDISAEDPSQETTEVESMCVNCQENVCYNNKTVASIVE